MSVLLGSQCTVLYDSSVVGFATDFDLTVNKESIDITKLTSGSWKENMVDMKDWSISFNGLVTTTDASVTINYDDLMYDIKNSSTAVTVGIKPTATSNKYETGLAFLTTLGMSGTVGDKVTFAGTLTGTGALTTSTVS
jgi:predicted secreted protein